MLLGNSGRSTGVVPRLRESIPRWRLLLICFCVANLANAAERPHSYGFLKLLHSAKQDAKWESAERLSDRMWLIRSYALKQSVVSNPVSSRYLITCHGGPIDLVHFFCLAAEVCSGEDWGPRLYKEWVREGGLENLQGFNFQQPPEAHPDDLPSNAFGALFGSEMRPHEDSMDIDLKAALIRFLKPLRPVPDAVSCNFSHREIVMGLPAKPSREQRAERYGWFTASPYISCAKINDAAQQTLGRKWCDCQANGESALRAAGFELATFRKRPIIIRRIP
jgi:hypothetical protein